MREVFELRADQDHRTRQGFYILPGRESLRPNATFVRGNQILFETNSYGLRGPEPDAERKLVVIWGDSVIFGLMNDWVTRLSSVLVSHQVLNGGMEGDVTRNIIKRAQLGHHCRVPEDHRSTGNHQHLI